MASFDTVSEVNMQELDNAVNNLKKELIMTFEMRYPQKSNFEK